jgi:hypothetical protein
MPEGLSPIEVGKQLHEHTSEPHQPDATRHSRTVQIREALLLSLVTIAAAWSGYAAAKWGTESRMELEVVGGAGGEPRPEPAEEPAHLVPAAGAPQRPEHGHRVLGRPHGQPRPGVAVVECFFCLDLADEGGGEEVVEVAHDHLQGRELGLLFF